MVPPNLNTRNTMTACILQATLFLQYNRLTGHGTGDMIALLRQNVYQLKQLPVQLFRIGGDLR